jgi:endonuclease G
MKQIRKYTLSLSFFLLLFVVSGCGGTNSGVIVTNPQESGSVFANTQCDVVVDKIYYEVCYSYSYKGARFVAYTLDGENVNNPNIEERFYFYEEELLPNEYRSRYDDYTGSGYDRGHLASDASFDWDEDALKSVYSMINIVPQNPEVNRYSWIDTEYEERARAVEFGSVDVVVALSYGTNPMQIGEDEIAVPEAMYKKISNETANYLACYKYENIPYDVESDSLQQHQIACDFFPFY